MSASSQVSDVMKRDLVTVPPRLPVSEAITLLLKHKVTGMPVVDEEGNLVGFLSERDCLKILVHARYHNLPTISVGELMTTEVETIGPEVDLLEVANLFLSKPFRRLPVVKDGRLVGLVSRNDVLRAIDRAEDS
ncbi:MAG: CBS domain-containing protein [Pirellulales bacterium]|nr:CBS domain-containing protein [Pirellulales bacterium]